MHELFQRSTIRSGRFCCGWDLKQLVLMANSKKAGGDIDTRKEKSCGCGVLQRQQQWHKKGTVCVCEEAHKSQIMCSVLVNYWSVSTLRDAQLSILISHLWHQPLASPVICKCAFKQSVLLIDSCILDIVNIVTLCHTATEIGKER